MKIRQRQYALGTSSGSGSHGNCKMHKDHEAKKAEGLLQLDMKNAFGTLRREETWRLLTKYAAQKKRRSGMHGFPHI